MAHIYSVKPARSYFIMLYHSNSICITINLFCFVSMIIVLNFLDFLDVRGHFWTVLEIRRIALEKDQEKCTNL